MSTEVSMHPRAQNGAVDRVREHTAGSVNARIDRDTAARVAEYSGLDPVARGIRLAELDREWDIDRMLMLLFSGLGALTFSLGMTRRGRIKRWNGWLSVFSAQIAFMGIHATVGWCPPMVVLRRLGVRTKMEIERERRALEAVDEGDPRPPRTTRSGSPG